MKSRNNPFPHLIYGLINRPLILACILGFGTSIILPGIATAAELVAAPDVATSSPSVESGTRTYQTPNWTTYYSDIDAIRADTQRSQAELDNLKIHHAIDEARRGNFSQSDGTSAPVQPVMPTMLPGNNASQQGPASTSHDPLVEQIRMVDGQWSAQIRLGSGAHVNARQGEAIRGVGTIESISLSEVLVKENGKSLALQFANDLAAESTVAPSSTVSRSTPMPFPFSSH